MLLLLQEDLFISVPRLISLLEESLKESSHLPAGYRVSRLETTVQLQTKSLLMCFWLVRHKRWSRQPQIHFFCFWQKINLPKLGRRRERWFGRCQKDCFLSHIIFILPFTLISMFLMDPGCALYHGSAAKTFTFSNPTAPEFSTLIFSLSSIKILYLGYTEFQRYMLYFDFTKNVFLYLNFPSRSSWDTRILVHLPIGGDGRFW